MEVEPDEDRSQPEINDLAMRVRFSLKEGRIWLDSERVALMHVSTLSALRRELIECLGMDEARGLLSRMGYNSGSRDAVLARKLRPHHSTRDAFLVGPQLRAIQGTAALEPVHLDLDPATGRFSGEFTWHDSFEVDAHIAAYGLSNSPACWMHLGYICGYATGFMGRTITFREVECRAMGSACCRVIGRPIGQWNASEDDLRALQPDNGTRLLGARAEASRRQASPVCTILQATTEEADLVGTSVGFRSVCHMVEKVAQTEATVLLLGETGVGKEMFARMLHRRSRRTGKPFIAVNCAAIPEGLIESELFGVEKGSYTGASGSRPGRFERAAGGTLFLDEVGTLTMTAQIKLLRAIQQKEIERIGDTTIRHVDVRIVGATNADLEMAVDSGQFRADLLYRLNVFPIRIPPLRERRDDIPLLVEHFLQKFAAIHGKAVSGFTESAIGALYEYDYPGNIRELENLIERAVILVENGGMIDVAHLFSSGDRLSSLMMRLVNGELSQGATAELAPQPPGSQALPSPPSLLDNLLKNHPAPLQQVETELMQEAVARCKGNLSKAARLLGVTRPQLAYRLRKRQPV